MAIHLARPTVPPMAMVAHHHGLPRRFAPRNDGNDGTEALSVTEPDGGIGLFSVMTAGQPQVNRGKQKIAKLRHREPQRGVAIHAARPTVLPMAMVVHHHGLPRRFAPRNDGTEALTVMTRFRVGNRF